MGQYKDDPDFSKENLKRDKRLYNRMEKASKTHDVVKEDAAEKAYYNDKYVKRLGKKRYQENMDRAKKETQDAADKEMDRMIDPKRRMLKGGEVGRKSRSKAGSSKRRTKR